MNVMPDEGEHRFRYEPEQFPSDRGIAFGLSRIFYKPAVLDITMVDSLPENGRIGTKTDWRLRSSAVRDVRARPCCRCRIRRPVSVIHT
jgi:hypothetical protein